MIKDFEVVIPPQGPLYLTEVEAKIVRMLAAGFSNQKIAETRGRSLQTIKNQLHLIYQRFGVTTARELLVKIGEIKPQNPKLFE